MKNIKGVTPGTAMWLCPLCGNVTVQQVNKEGCTCTCKERHGEYMQLAHPQLQIYIGYSVVIEDEEEKKSESVVQDSIAPVETTVYRFYSVCENTVWSSPIEGFDVDWYSVGSLNLFSNPG